MTNFKTKYKKYKHKYSNLKLYGGTPDPAVIQLTKLRELDTVPIVAIPNHPHQYLGNTVNIYTAGIINTGNSVRNDIPLQNIIRNWRVAFNDIITHIPPSYNIIIHHYDPDATIPFTSLSLESLHYLRTVTELVHNDVRLTNRVIESKFYRTVLPDMGNINHPAIIFDFTGILNLGPDIPGIIWIYMPTGRPFQIERLEPLNNFFTNL